MDKHLFYSENTVILYLNKNKSRNINYQCFEKIENPFASNDSKDSENNHLKESQNYLKSRNVVVFQDSKISAKPHIPRVPDEVCNSVIEIPISQNHTNDPLARISSDKAFWIGFDSEWQYLGNSNKILSYQFWIYELNQGLILLVNGKRLSMKEVISTLYEFLRDIGVKKVKEINLVSHFSRAEMFSLDLKRSIDGIKNIKEIRGSMASLKYDEISFYDKNKNKKSIKMKLYDTALLSDIRIPLKKLGEYVGVEKIENKDFIERMEWLLENDFKTYISYSIVDSVISVLFAMTFFNTLKNELGIDKPPITASQIGVVLFKNKVENAEEFMGYSNYVKSVFRNGKTIKSRGYKLQRKIRECEDAYYGGRNETFLHGYFKDMEAYDYDIKNAYPSAMLALKDIDWERQERLDLEDIEFNDVGFAEARFKFRDDVLYPLFPIKTEYGSLIFPQQGKTIITLPELYTAYHNDMVSDLELIDCVRFRKKDDNTMSIFMKDLILKRNQYDENSIENLIYKLIANSFYGKIAQGINSKTGVNIIKSLQSGEIARERFGEGSIYNPAIAAFITGFIRAVIGEYLHYCSRKDIQITYVTTDGFMITSKLNNEELKGVGEMSKILSDVRRFYLKDDEVLKLKHQGKKVLALKTRGYLIMENFKGVEKDQRLVAKGGIQTKKGLSKDEVIDHLFKTYLQASPNMTYKQRHLSNITEYIEDDIEDLIDIEREVSVNMDYDFKRKPIDAKEDDEYKKVIFNTIPYRDVEEFLTTKRGYENFNKHYASNNKIRTLKEYEEFQKYLDGIRISDSYTKTDIEKTILKKLTYTSLLLGYDRKEITKKLGVDRFFVRNNENSKIFKKIKDGELEMKKIPYDLYQKYETLIQSKLTNFEEHQENEILSMVIENPQLSEVMC